MEIGEINKLIDYWKKNNLSISRIGIADLNNILNIKRFFLPNDFKELYVYANGIDDCDSEGFLFYKIEDLETMGEKFSLDKGSDLYNIVLFADYMQQSWWYGIKLIHNENYEIGIVATSLKFKKIANSLSDFITLYLEDSQILYEYD
jgi:hypothetical protein